MRPKYRSLGVLGAILMALAIWKMMMLPLWGYWPLCLGVGFCLLLVPVYTWRFTSTEVGTALASGLVLALSFPPIPLPILAMLGFIPLLYLVDQYKKESVWVMLRSVGTLSFLAFLLWNVGATFWVMNTAFVAGIFANVVNAFLMSIPMVAYALIRKYYTGRYHWIAWIGLWLAFEYFHYNWELHWPWLTLGNAFASWPWAIQWYDITGVLGGSFWVLAMNWLLFHAFFYKSGRIKNYILAGLLLFGGVIFSLIWYPSKAVNPERVHIAIIQPNFEPHYEKFEIPARDQLNKIRTMIDSVVNDSTDYLILPETVFTLSLNHLEREPEFLALKKYQNQYPDLKIVVGLATQRVLQEGEESNKFTRETPAMGGRIIRWEAANTAMYIHDNQQEFYYKTKLVPGAEFFPYNDYLFFLQPIVDKLEGSIKGFRTQEEVTVFKDGATMAPIICYESIFGEYCREYIAKGADLFTVITNDGWWDNTPGHMQHFGYSVLLAIQHRRAIARAANTGISALILPNGMVKEKTGYEEDAVITGTLPLHRELTFYSQWGDLLGRIGVFIVIVLLLQGLYLIVNRRVLKNSKNNQESQ